MFALIRNASSARQALRIMTAGVAVLVLAACADGDKPKPQAPIRPLPPIVQTPPPDAGARDDDLLLRPPHMGDREVVRVGLLLPLSGRAGAVGQAMLDAAQLALFEFDDADILLIPKDTGGDPVQASKAAREVLAEGADIILGPLFAQSVGMVAPLARQRQVPVIAFSTDRQVAGDGVYLLSFLPEDDVTRVVDYAVLEGHTRFAAMIPQNAYGERVRAVFTRALADRGLSVAAIETYPVTSDGMFGPAERLAHQQENFDAVLLPAGGNELQALAPLLPYFDVDPRETKFLGTGLWDDPAVVREPTLNGGWFAAPPPDARLAFAARFERVYGTTPARIASLAYDAMSLAIALSGGEPGMRYPAAELTAADGFAGTDGVFRFTPDGLNERALAVMEVRPSGFQVVSPAPASLTAGTVY